MLALCMYTVFMVDIDFLFFSKQERQVQTSLFHQCLLKIIHALAVWRSAELKRKQTFLTASDENKSHVNNENTAISVELTTAELCTFN